MLMERDATGALPFAVDTSNCDREPIHQPSSIQPHGVLMVLSEPDLAVVQVSMNSREYLGLSPDEILGRPLGRALGDDVAEDLARGIERMEVGSRPRLLRIVTVEAGGRTWRFHAVGHRVGDRVVLELEASDGKPILDFHPTVDRFTLEVEAVTSIPELTGLMAREARRLTGFDRVLVYRFDEGWNGTVVAEDGNGRLPSLLHHRFPASDIPAQARELYRTNRMRIIPDSGYSPVALVPSEDRASGARLDMSFATLRSVSPVHLQYMKNMETASSMSVSILRNGELWGLVSFHHREPRTADFPIRVSCDLMARVFALRLSGLEHNRGLERRMEVRSACSRLVAVMADRGDFVSALKDFPEDLLGIADSTGAAILTEGECLLLGETPTEEQTRALASWLFAEGNQDVFLTDSLPGVYAPSSQFKGVASGLLAIAVSKLHPSFVLWFRPEVIQTVKWGGPPEAKARVESDGVVTLHPRTSFETWKQTVRDRSVPWRSSEVEGVTDLRNTIVGSVLRRAEELASLNAELRRSNKELEAFSYSVSHDLRAPLRHIVGYAQLLRESAVGKLSDNDERFIATIIESSEYAGNLVDKLLGFSRLGRSELQKVDVDLGVLVREIRTDVMRDAEGRDITWTVGPLPTVRADLMMLRMAVRDLLSNALKYTRKTEKVVIEVGYRDEGNEHVFFVKDNGVGFDMEFAGKLFGVFQRLHRWEDYEGTGIGLANVRRVIERHDGRTWAEGAENLGATFFFTLPRRSRET